MPGTKRLPGELQTYECDGCGSTTTCLPPEIFKGEGWTRHEGKGWKLILCPECEPPAKR